MQRSEVSVKLKRSKSLSFPQDIYCLESIRYERYAVDDMWIKREVPSLFYFVEPRCKIIPVSVAAHR
jgi:hypothetical protein